MLKKYLLIGILLLIVAVSGCTSQNTGGNYSTSPNPIASAYSFYQYTYSWTDATSHAWDYATHNYQRQPSSSHPRELSSSPERSLSSSTTRSTSANSGRTLSSPSVRPNGISTECSDWMRGPGAHTGRFQFDYW